MNKKALMLIGAVIAIVIAMAYWLVGGNEPDIVVPENQPPQSENLAYMSNEMSEERDGKKIWELKSDVIEIDSNTQDTILKRVDGIFYQENGTVIRLTADYAVYNAETKKLHINGDVAAASDDGAKLNADEVDYDAARRSMSGTGNIRLERDGTVITGERFETDAGFENFRVTGNARVRKQEAR